MSKRFLSLWFPQFWVDVARRRDHDLGDGAALAVTERRGNREEVISICPLAHQCGVRLGQSLRDAQAIAPQLRLISTTALDAPSQLAALRRWATRYSPWIAHEGRDGLCLDLTGCAHLWGGEAMLAQDLQEQLTRFGYHSRLAIAQTRGAAWAHARFTPAHHSSARTGDAIDQEARATRARAPRRPKWADFGQAAPQRETQSVQPQIIPTGQLYPALAPLPVAALRLEQEDIAQLQRLGLRRIGDLLGQPRGPLARRFGQHVMLRLDQAMGTQPEPITPVRDTPPLAVRMSLPDPIGLRPDIDQALARLLERLCTRLKAQSMGARAITLSLYMAEGGAQHIPLALARPHHDVAAMQALFDLKLKDIDVGFGIDMMRLEVTQAEPISLRQPVGHLDITRHNQARQNDPDQQIQDLISRLGTRIGIEAITRYHPCATHIPEKAATAQAAAFSEAAPSWPPPRHPRPLRLWPPTPIEITQDGSRLVRLTWGGSTKAILSQRGPERIMPQWWLDDPNWRSGVRDYWDIHTADGRRLWIFYAHGHEMSAGWFCHGNFA